MAEQQDSRSTLSTRLSARQVYQSVRHDGEQELSRPVASLWWPGLAAGIALASSVVAKGLLHKELPDAAWRTPVADVGYCVGFILVV